MTAPRDPDQLIHAFLDEGRTELPDRAYDAVRDHIDHPRQRVVIGPWRESDMNTYAKLALAAAAVLVVAVIGTKLCLVAAAASADDRSSHRRPSHRRPRLHPPLGR